MGYFREARLVPFVASIINVVLSIYLGRHIGLTGIYLATCISRIFTFNTIDAILVLKKGLNASVLDYLLFQLSFVLVVILSVAICSYVVSYVHIQITIVSLIVKAIVVGIISNVLFLLVYGRTSSFRSLKTRLLAFVRK